MSKPSSPSTPPPNDPTPISVAVSSEDSRRLKKIFGFDPDDADVSIKADFVDLRKPPEPPIQGQTSQLPPVAREIEKLVDLLMRATRPLRRAAVEEDVSAAVTDPKFSLKDITEHVCEIMADIAAEADRATDKYGSFKSAHEGYAILKEEVDELWDYIKDNLGYADVARKEAIQIAAMALKYVVLVDAKQALIDSAKEPE